jgi:thiamine phosphate synthase YjbQ (UPF0047 family)
MGMPIHMLGILAANRDKDMTQKGKTNVSSLLRRTGMLLFFQQHSGATLFCMEMQKYCQAEPE